MKNQRDYVQQRYYRVFRNEYAVHSIPEIVGDVSLQRRMALYFKAMCEVEMPIVFPTEKIAFTRTNRELPPPYSFEHIEKEYDTNKKYYNVINNVCPDYSIVLNEGLSGIRRRVEAEMPKCSNNDEKDFIESCIIVLDSISELVKRYKKEAEKVGNKIVADNLSRVPEQPAVSFLEALQTIRIISSMFYLSGNYQLGFGRIDQYLYKYYLHDKDNGISDEELQDYIEEFFLSLNRDSDLYFGEQQGDNGQSMMLGGVTVEGENGINELTYMMLKASKKLKLIDPKINLRIDSNTPEDLIALGCELTKEGLGFPQYSNDEVVIPALVKIGYDLQDARNYTVAACWEFIIPGYGMDIVNQGAVSFPFAVDSAINDSDINSLTVEAYEKKVSESIDYQVNNILRNRDQYLLPSPLVSMMFHGPIEERRDLTKCAKYRNRGIHGAGSADAADAMYIIEDLLKNDKAKLKHYQECKNKNFEDSQDVLNEISNHYPKVGNADERVDNLVAKLFGWFADACEKYSTPTCKVRAGSGSAQFYTWLVDKQRDYLIEPKVSATLDGRREGEPFASSLAPSSIARVDGLVSTLKSFSVIDYSRVINGGPITVELSPSVFRTREGILKLKDIIKYFVQIGNQQLQINVLDEKELEDAMKNPDRHRNLIVRVWGWSGYFCELAPEFQKQIINRHKFGL